MEEVDHWGHAFEGYPSLLPLFMPPTFNEFAFAIQSGCDDASWTTGPEPMEVTNGAFGILISEATSHSNPPSRCLDRVFCHRD